MDQSNPDPSTLDVAHVARQIEELYEAPDPDNVDAVLLHGSFANPEKPVDRTYESDVDVFFVVADDARPDPGLNPFSKVPTITLLFDDDEYVGRAVDALVGTWESFQNSADTVFVEIPADLPKAPE